jgi:hypothetical protein
MKVKLIAKWYDMWVGAFWDSSKRRLYILPIPCVGIVLCFGYEDSCGTCCGNALQYLGYGSVGDCPDCEGRGWNKAL